MAISEVSSVWFVVATVIQISNVHRVTVRITFSLLDHLSIWIRWFCSISFFVWHRVELAKSAWVNVIFIFESDKKRILPKEPFIYLTRRDLSVLNSLIE